MYVCMYGCMYECMYECMYVCLVAQRSAISVSVAATPPRSAICFLQTNFSATQ